MNITLVYYESEVGLVTYPSFAVKSRSSENVSAVLN